MTLLLNLEIVISPTQKAELQIFEDQTPKQLAQMFVQQQNLHPSMIEPIALYISQQVQLLNEESYSSEDSFSSISSVEKPTFIHQQEYSKRLATSKIIQDKKQELPSNKVGDDNSQAFNRLYADALRRKVKKQESPKKRQQVISSCQMYEKSMNFLSSKQMKLENQRNLIESQKQKIEEAELKNCTFQPKITQKAHYLNFQKDAFSRLTDNNFIERRKHESFVQIVSKTRKQETFKPKINDNFQRCKSKVKWNLQHGEDKSNNGIYNQKYKTFE